MRRLSAGVGLKPVHLADALAARADGLWFEVHPENWQAAGGPRPRLLDAIRAVHPLSLHDLGLSLASSEAPDPAHLARLAAQCARHAPALVSAHLAWSRWRGVVVPDLLPAPRTREALDYVVRNVDCVQTALARRIAIENPSHYLRLEAHEMEEVEFLTALVARTGCGLLVDVNNLYVSENNVGADASAWIDAVPGAAVMEIHLAGHAPDPVLGAQLLIDSHDRPVATTVWQLYERLIRRIGPRPTLIERDESLPSFPELLAERTTAAALLHGAPASALRNCA